jgi:hypothetical protein
MRISFRAFVAGALWAGLGYACGSGGAGDAVMAAATLIELNGGSLAEQLGEAGPPPITPGFGVAERVPDDGTRHFTVTVATENRAAGNDAAALYALMDAHDAAGQVWGANVLAFAHADMRGGAVQGLEVDVGNLGTAGDVPVTGLNVFAIGAKRSNVAIGVLNGTAADAGGFREGIAFHSNAPGTAVSEALVRVHPGFGEVATGIDLRGARFTGPALATPGFIVDGRGGIQSTALALGSGATNHAYVCVDDQGRMFASGAPCGLSAPPP